MSFDNVFEFIILYFYREDFCIIKLFICLCMYKFKINLIIRLFFINSNTYFYN